MEITSLIMPAVVGGLMLWGKQRSSAAYTWINSDAASVQSMPVALLLAQASSGDALPAPPAGNTWNPIQVNFAASPFSTPQSLTINVLQPIPGYVAPAGTQAATTPSSPAQTASTTQLNMYLGQATTVVNSGVTGSQLLSQLQAILTQAQSDPVLLPADLQTLTTTITGEEPSAPAATPTALSTSAVAPAPSPAASTPAVTGASGFLTSQSIVAASKGPGLSGFLTAQQILPAGLNGFLTRQEFDEAGGGMGEAAPPIWCGTERYSGPPAAIPGSGGILGTLAAELHAKGLVLAPIGPNAVCHGDYVVTTDGSLYMAVGYNQYKKLAPTAGYVGPLLKPFKAGYGVRRT
jgi:hypothetical protein